MRFPLVARQIILAPALAVALALAVAACSSSSSPSGSSAPAASAPASSAPASSAPASSLNTATAAAEITANWEKFFNSSTPVAEKVTLLQHGSVLEPAIKAFDSLPLASGIGAKVTNVTMNSATSATVTYDLTGPGGSSLLPNQKGTAVYENGTWKVGTASLCGLLKLIPGGSVPSACNSAS